MAKLIILSGAGLSAESGIATFRDKNGLWERYDLEEVCNISTWKQNFEKVHQFYNERRLQLGKVGPNAAHFQIAQWEAKYETVLLTQNIDDLLERGGCKEVNHLHGFLTQMHCKACGHRWSIGYTEWKVGDRCRRESCRSARGVKPNVVFFGETAPMYSLLRHTVEDLQSEDVFLVMGTMGAVLPIDSMARRAKCTRILNNLAEGEEINAKHFEHVFYEPATQAISKIDAVLQKVLGS